MNLPTLCIKKPVMTTLVMLSIAFFGYFSYKSLPVSDLPNVEFPTITVSLSYPGASPETISASCAVPLERQFMTIDGVHTLFSRSQNGSLTAVLQFVLEKSMDSAAVDVQAAINRALPNLPDDLPSSPTYKKINPAQTPILYIAVTSDALDKQKLYDYANTYIGQRLSILPGVSQVITFGSPYAARIQIDPGKLAHIGLTMKDVVQAVTKANVDLPTGVLYGKARESTIDVDGQIMSAEGYEKLVLRSKDGKTVCIGDVGRAVNSLEDDKYSLTYRQKNAVKPCVVLAVQTLPGANTVSVTDQIFQTLPSLKKELPASLRYATLYNKKTIILDSVRDVKLTLWIAFILVVGIIYLFFGKWQNTLIPSFAIPLSILGTFCLLYILGYSLDILSLLALTLSIGFLVDDAIVVLENIIRHVHEGKSPRDAAMIGSTEITSTVVSMSLCLISVFFPMLFLDSILGRLFREFSLTIMIAVGFSGAIALSLTPLLCSRCIKKRSQKAQKSRVERQTEKCQKALLSLYQKALTWAFKKKRFVLFLGFLSFVGSVVLIKEMPTDFLPVQDEGFIQGFTQSQDGTSPFSQKEKQDQIAAICANDPAVQSVVSMTSVSSVVSDNQGLFFLQLKPLDKRASLSTVVEDLQKKIEEVPGINAYLSPLPLINLTLGTTTKALYQYSLTGIDTKTLYPAVEKMVAEVKKRRDLFTEVSSDLQISQPQTQITIRRKQAAELGIDARDIEDLFSYAYSTNKISTIYGALNQYDVIVETLPQFYRDSSAFSYLFLRNKQNLLVPLTQVVDTKESVGPLSMTHINGLPAATISFNVAPGKTLGEAISVLEKYSAMLLPRSVSGRSSGSAEVFQKSVRSMALLFLLTVFVIYLILGILYEHFLHPLTVMSALFPATFGGLFSLYIMGKALSLFSFVGIIMLLGIVMKNGIMMVDFANTAIKKGSSSYDAIFTACILRFRPILMTSFAALMGALPIALGIGGPSASTRAPLGIAVVGGLLFSQVLTLFLTPVIFYCLETAAEKVGKMLYPSKKKASK
mgnify:FL=1